MLTTGAVTEGDALAQLRHAVGAGRRAAAPRFDVLYRMYVTTLLGLFGFYLALGLVDDLPVDTATVNDIASRGPAWVGAVAALCLAVGVRSGANGGPLAIDERELHHVLLSPIDRSPVLRETFRRLVLFAVLGGAVVGAAAGELASRRLPGPQLEWVASGSLTAIAIVLAGVGAAAIAAAYRLRPAIATVIALVVLGWEVVALVDTLPSPFDGLGQVALWPLRHEALAIAGLVVPIAMVWFGHRGIGALSIERAHHRTRLVAQVRFALAQQDLRALLLLRRQLAHESPRRRPWLTIGAGGAIENRFPVFVRDIRSYARWPLGRILRVTGLAVVAGLALGGMWAGTTALIGLCGVALYLAALEVVEPFSQELDHPAILEAVPTEDGPIMLWHLATGAVAMVLVWAIVGAVTMLTTLDLVAGAVVAIAAVPAAAAAAAAASLSIRRIGAGSETSMVPDEIAGPQMLMRLLWPPALTLLGALPVLLARNAAADDLQVTPVAARTAILVGSVASIAVMWIRYRDHLSAAMLQAQAER